MRSRAGPAGPEMPDAQGRLLNGAGGPTLGDEPLQALLRLGALRERPPRFIDRRIGPLEFTGERGEPVFGARRMAGEPRGAPDGVGEASEIALGGRPALPGTCKFLFGHEACVGGVFEGALETRDVFTRREALRDETAFDPHVVDRGPGRGIEQCRGEMCIADQRAESRDEVDDTAAGQRHLTLALEGGAVLIGHDAAHGKVNSHGDCLRRVRNGRAASPGRCGR
jgi:hypothetical protein